MCKHQATRVYCVHGCLLVLIRCQIFHVKKTPRGIFFVSGLCWTIRWSKSGNGRPQSLLCGKLSHNCGTSPYYWWDNLLYIYIYMYNIQYKWPCSNSKLLSYRRVIMSFFLNLAHLGTMFILRKLGQCPLGGKFGSARMPGQLQVALKIEQMQLLIWLVVWIIF